MPEKKCEHRADRFGGVGGCGCALILLLVFPACWPILLVLWVLGAFDE